MPHSRPWRCRAWKGASRRCCNSFISQSSPSLCGNRTHMRMQNMHIMRRRKRMHTLDDAPASPAAGARGHHDQVAAHAAGRDPAVRLHVLHLWDSGGAALLGAAALQVGPDAQACSSGKYGRATGGAWSKTVRWGSAAACAPHGRVSCEVCALNVQGECHWALMRSRKKRRPQTLRTCCAGVRSRLSTGHTLRQRVTGSCWAWRTRCLMSRQATCAVGPWPQVGWWWWGGTSAWALRGERAGVAAA